MKSYPVRSIYLLFVILSHEERIVSFSLEIGQLVLKLLPHEKLPSQKYLPAVCHSQPWGESYLFLSRDWTVGSQAPPTWKVTQSEVFTCCLSFSAMRRELSLSLWRFDSWFSSCSHMKVTQSEVFTCCLSFSAMRRLFFFCFSLCRLDSWFSNSSHIKSYPIRSIYLLFVILSHEERVVSFSL